ncbi:MAG: zinc ribbon domain-containing protein [Bacteroidota bacterium]
MKKCHQCGTLLPDTARFCVHCGAKQIERNETEVPPSDALNFSGDLPKQLQDRFFKALKTRVKEEHEADQFPIYSERLYESGFRDTVQLRTNQLSEEIRDLRDSGDLDQKQAIIIMNLVFDELLDFFIINFCKDINIIKLPEQILQYQGMDWDEINLLKMCKDYLDLKTEKEKFYTDFLLMPIEKLKTASKSFLFPDKKEKIYLICDQSLFGNFKEGFALTEKGLYWKAHLEKPRAVKFDSLDELKRHKDWITINGFFFSVNKSINLKMLKLLKRIKSLQRKVI